VRWEGRGMVEEKGVCWCPERGVSRLYCMM